MKWSCISACEQGCSITLNSSSNQTANIFKDQTNLLKNQTNIRPKPIIWVPFCSLGFVTGFKHSYTLFPSLPLAFLLLTFFTIVFTHSNSHCLHLLFTLLNQSPHPPILPPKPYLLQRSTPQHPLFTLKVTCRPNFLISTKRENWIISTLHKLKKPNVG